MRSRESRRGVEESRACSSQQGTDHGREAAGVAFDSLTSRLSTLDSST